MNDRTIIPPGRGDKNKTSPGRKNRIGSLPGRNGRVGHFSRKINRTESSPRRSNRSKTSSSQMNRAGSSPERINRVGHFSRRNNTTESSPGRNNRTKISPRRLSGDESSPKRNDSTESSPRQINRTESTATRNDKTESFSRRKNRTRVTLKQLSRNEPSPGRKNRTRISLSSGQKNVIRVSLSSGQKKRTRITLTQGLKKSTKTPSKRKDKTKIFSKREDKNEYSSERSHITATSSEHNDEIDSVNTTKAEISLFKNEASYENIKSLSQLDVLPEKIKNNQPSWLPCDKYDNAISTDDHNVRLDKRKTEKELTVSCWNFDENGIGQSGHILSRTSKVDLLFRKWKAAYWVHVQPAILLFFRSEKDIAIWRDDPSKKRLISWAINFDTKGFLEKKLKKHTKEKLGRECASAVKYVESVGKKEQSSEDISSSFPKGKTKLNHALVCAEKGVLKYSMTDIHSKLYEKEGTVLHGFKLERWVEVGMDILAAFASSKPEEIKSFRRVIKSCIEVASKA